MTSSPLELTIAITNDDMCSLPPLPSPTHTNYVTHLRRPFFTNKVAGRVLELHKAEEYLLFMEKVHNTVTESLEIIHEFDLTRGPQESTNSRDQDDENLHFAYRYGLLNYQRAQEAIGQRHISLREQWRHEMRHWLAAPDEARIWARFRSLMSSLRRERNWFAHKFNVFVNGDNSTRFGSINKIYGELIICIEELSDIIRASIQKETAWGHKNYVQEYSRYLVDTERSRAAEGCIEETERAEFAMQECDPQLLENFLLGLEGWENV
jgi:hypothetical protein